MNLKKLASFLGVLMGILVFSVYSGGHLALLIVLFDAAGVLVIAKQALHEKLDKGAVISLETPLQEAA